MRRGVWAGSSVWRVRGAGWRGGTLMNRLESMAVAPLWWSVGLRSGCLASVGPASFGFQSGFSRSFVVRRSYEGSWLRSQKSWRCVGHAPVGRRVRRAGRQRWSPTSTSSFWPSVLALRSVRAPRFSRPPRRLPMLVASEHKLVLAQRFGPAFGALSWSLSSAAQVANTGRQRAVARFGSAFWPCVRRTFFVSGVRRAGH